MYHLTDDGPKPCTASIRNCPYAAGEHHATLSEAEAAYAERFDQKALKRSSAPAKSGIVPATTAEAFEILEDLRAANPYKRILKGELVGHAQFGSVSYNLDHPESDNDLFLITDRKASKDFAQVGEVRDVRVSSVYVFAQEYMKGIHFNVDTYHSRGFNLSGAEEEWAPYLADLRFNEYEYMTRLHSLSSKFADGAEKRGDDSPRAMKFLKTALRNEILANRFQREERVRPKFTDEEREAFYRTLPALTRRYKDVNNVYDFVTELAKEVD